MQTKARTRETGRRNAAGFTLVELILAILISALIMIAITTAHISQQRTHSAQEQVGELQQNIRTAMTIMSGDIRMAGYKRNGKGKAKIESAEHGRFAFTREVDGATKIIGYRLDKRFDTDGDGVVDTYSPSGIDDHSRGPTLRRIWNNPDAAGSDPAGEAIASFVEALEFVYLVGDDMKAKLDPDADEMKDIRAVTVTLLMRSLDPDPTLAQDAREMRPASRQLYGMHNPDWPTFAVKDQYRRRLHYTTVQLRNANLVTAD